jgi:hypothetical protein
MKFIEKLLKKRNNSVTSDADWDANLEQAMESAVHEIPIERRQQLLNECIIRVFADGMPGLEDDLPFAPKK